ncbi:sphinganine-1-phosphate aldolase DPL1 TDEL_0E03170 [Torulaspora delbrueckii]|uniref:sphinganine-1-phosphate aldolase n=1 Tax=Torulaspora delbrueckii TaxID=4950 RepID=G8ZVB6_TORDE|nr:hypothetical protein TDEL_0E03170 [Torulaspora delbrueckii]CCE92560.1 hypothetical protein TDEL_0E03170 [Torulaspora delbrueckii]
MKVEVNTFYIGDELKLKEILLTGYAYCRNYLQTSSWISILKDYLLLVFTYRLLNFATFQLKVFGLRGSLGNLYRSITSSFFKWLLRSSLMKSSVDVEVNKATRSIERDLIKNDASLKDFEELPAVGLSEKTLLEELDLMDSILPHTEWKRGRVSGAVYHGGDELVHLQSLAFEKFCVANQLHPDVFPAVRKMEAEVVSMTLNLFNAPKDTGCGTTSSGGTESLLLACLSAKMYAYHHRGVTEPEMIIPVTAHAGFDKAGYYFGIKIHHARLDPVTFKVDLKQVKKFINKNTVLLVGSAPNFPHGIVDDIQGLSDLALRYKIPLHVDCCLGSFIVAFMSKAGFKDLAPFDFRVPGVTSISCDTHKYGFAPKGSSVIMYRNNDLRMHQYYVSTDWTGGLYGSPTLAGSRPGALVVGCWATMISMGQKCYIDSCKEIVNASRKLKATIQRDIPDLRVLGDPICSVVSFTSDRYDVYELGDKLAKRGWHLSSLQKPPALHLAITKPSASSIDELIETLKELVSEARKDPDSKPSSDGTSALYGVAGSVKTTGVADRLIVGFLDTLFKLKPADS